MDDKKTRRRLTFAALNLIVYTVVVPFLIVFLPSVLVPGDAELEIPETTQAHIQEQDFAVGIDNSLRGVYIATVSNINYPSKQGLDADELARELDVIIENVKKANLNAIFFQVRPCADAFYESNIFPTSKFLSGEQGKGADEDFDPLAYLINRAHADGIAVHAWINPLRISDGSVASPAHELSALAETSPARQNPEWVVCYGDGKMYFDPGYEAVRDLVAVGVAEILTCYDVDGIMFDDYFYPYPVYDKNGKICVFDDSASYKEYEGELSLAEWRRENINELIKLCHNTVKTLAPECAFGVAPFGIWANDNEENGGSATKGLSAYDEIYCDSLAWVRGGYVDYIAPQIYWFFDTDAAPYAILVDWWSEAVGGSGVQLLVSLGVYRYEEGAPAGELSRQLEYAYSRGVEGSILYGYEQITSNTSGVRDEIISVFAPSGE